MPGLCLPLALVYVTRDVGLPLGTAGTLVSLGTLAGNGLLGLTAGARSMTVGEFARADADLLNGTTS